MKKLAILFSGILISIALNAQVPPSPNGGSAPNSGSNTPVGSGGGAAIGGGIGILLVLGAGYGLKRVYDVKLKKLND